VAVYNTVQGADQPPGEDLLLDPFLLAVDGFIPLIEVGYAAEWSVAEWRPVIGDSGGVAYDPVGPLADQPDTRPTWPEAVRSLMTLDCALLFPPDWPSWDGLFTAAGEVLRLPTFVGAWAVGVFLALLEGDASEETDGNTDRTDDSDGPSLLERSIQAIERLNPENTLRWLWTIYHGVGWALISMAIVTFTGVMRRD
jgi:hypothetical protein